ncbi:MAG: aspartate aminotransferase family protein [Sedimentisphaerales bacterium]|nr:aspartate aminotransferase family protein [Sedimentisphaerales bacterium]
MPENKTPGPKTIIEKKKKYLIPCIYHFYKNPPHIVRGEGMYLYDSQGRQYIDFYSGVSVNALGHCHPEITDAICRQVKTLQHTTTIYLTEPIVNLAEQMAQILPGKLCRTFFCCSGSEANEGAALLATLYTGRSEFLALQNGLHGRTKLGMSLTGLSFWRTDPNPVGGITFIPAPTCYRCPFGQSYGQCQFQCIQAVEQAILTSTSGKPAAMFVEPIQGNGGIQVPPAEYFPKLRQVLDKYQMLLITDEVQTGFGRTGKMFSMGHWDVVPDIITGGKALGGGTPVGFFSTTEKIAQKYTRPGASTFGGNPVTATAALSFLKVLRRDGLVDRSQKLGQQLLKNLQTVLGKHPFVADIRGKGLMVGVELKASETIDAPALTDMVLENMKDSGFLLGKTGPGRNVLTLMPPLIVEEQQIQQVVDELGKVLDVIH